LERDVLIRELEGLAGSFLEGKGLELVELDCRNEGQRMVVRVLADRVAGSITIGECALFCRSLKDLLEEKNIISGDYLLEVSSPGLDRPLKKEKDFLRCLDKEAVFFLNAPVAGKIQWQGVIRKVEEGNVFVQSGPELLELPLVKINKAKLVIL
jgi:ribosome maturation factor RimP